MRKYHEDALKLAFGIIKDEVMMRIELLILKWRWIMRDLRNNELNI